MIKKKVRTISATDEEMEMLTAIADYHGSNKSATVAGLIKKEFWRIFPAGNGRIQSVHQAQKTPETMGNGSER